ncbi:hypothetical protein ACIPW5_10565 [Streptomyces sp. NPDC090077]|uniref:hypothetical protein n=1 Tax=Streptomyces sp. NPDC090077 TaxID=3365938 RepID=UPI0038266BCC
MADVGTTVKAATSSSSEANRSGGVSTTPPLTARSFPSTRWLADPALVQHARNRADVARVLGVEERMIWPEAVTSRVKVGQDRELVHSYPYRSACPSTTLEVRVSAPEDATNHVVLSVFRFDSDALVTPHLARVIGHDSPMFHLRRQNKEGMFDRFAGHAEELWERGTPYAFDQPMTAAGR